MRNDVRNPTVCMTPIVMIFLPSPKLLNFEIAFIATAVGSIPRESTNRTVAADAYSGPIMLRISLGATMSAATTGAVRVKPSLRLPDDKSTLDSVEAGITVYDMLIARLAPTTLSIMAI